MRPKSLETEPFTRLIRRNWYREILWTCVVLAILIIIQRCRLVGDKVPADSRIVEIMSSAFRVDQSILTGESVSVGKTIAPISDARAVKQDMTNILFSVFFATNARLFVIQGTTIASGKARAVVVATGAHTAIGSIHTSISSQGTEKSPLKKKLDDFGDSLAKVADSNAAFLIIKLHVS